MNEQKVIEIIHNFLETKFPHTCPCCGKEFSTLKDFIQNTKSVGSPISYDEEKLPLKPIGTYAHYNCICGSTVILGSKGMNILTLWRLMLWGRKQARLKGVSMSDILLDIRKKVDKKVLGS